MTPPMHDVPGGAGGHGNIRTAPAVGTALSADTDLARRGEVPQLCRGASLPSGVQLPWYSGSISDGVEGGSSCASALLLACPKFLYQP